jgi:phosphatidylglycerophosphatase C
MTTIAAFDLDGTLSRRDTVLPFLARVAGPGAVAAALARDWRGLWRMRAGGDHRDAAKVALLARLLSGRPLADLRTAGARYADELVTRGRLRGDVLGRLEWHRDRGDDVVLVTAALDLYASPLARLLGVDVSATRLHVDAGGRCTGALDGANCRGEEKARRLRERLTGVDAPTVWAYGNSAEDRPMLAMADVAVWVDRRPIPAVPAPPD